MEGGKEGKGSRQKGREEAKKKKEEKQRRV